MRLIRSKGVGVFFVTQTPKDIHGDVLGQLGNRVQHALRAFTPDDAKALKATVSTFPKSEFYDLEELLTAARDRRGGGDDPVRERRADAGRAHASCGRPPRGWARPTTSTRAAKASPLYAKYGTRSDAQSAREMLAARLEQPAAAGGRAAAEAERAQGRRRRRRGGGAGAIGDFLNSSAGQAAAARGRARRLRAAEEALAGCLIRVGGVQREEARLAGRQAGRDGAVGDDG